MVNGVAFIKGINFATFARRGVLGSQEAHASRERMLKELAPDFVILTPAAMQQTAHSTQIDFAGPHTSGDEELIETIRFFHQRGVRVALKPTVNCLDGTWRAYISFIEPDVPSEPKWHEWFASYTAFQLHFARIAQQESCCMFIPGCEMVMADHRDAEWRKLIADIRGVFSGLIAYNCDKYQEDHVTWWDCVDVIASSGYYPTGDWDRQLDRIEKVVEKYQKPFFFSELGCMAVKGAAQLPNDWSLTGEPDVDEQTCWYQDMFQTALKRPWVGGFAFWDWAGIPYTPDREGHTYDLRGTKAAQLVHQVYTSPP